MTAFDDMVRDRIRRERETAEALKLRGINSTSETRIKLRPGPVARWLASGYLHQEHGWALDRIMAGWYAITRDVTPTSQRVERLPDGSVVMALWKTDGARSGNDPERMAALSREYTAWRDELRRQTVRGRPGTRWITALRRLGEGHTLTDIAFATKADRATTKLALRDLLDIYLDLRRG